MGPRSWITAMFQRLLAWSGVSAFTMLWSVIAAITAGTAKTLFAAIAANIPGFVIFFSVYTTVYVLAHVICHRRMGPDARAKVGREAADGEDGDRS